MPMILIFSVFKCEGFLLMTRIYDDYTIRINNSLSWGKIDLFENGIFNLAAKQPSYIPIK